VETFRISADVSNHPQVRYPACFHTLDANLLIRCQGMRETILAPRRLTTSVLVSSVNFRRRHPFRQINGKLKANAVTGSKFLNTHERSPRESESAPLRAAVPRLYPNVNALATMSKAGAASRRVPVGGARKRFLASAMAGTNEREANSLEKADSMLPCRGVPSQRRSTAMVKKEMFLREKFMAWAWRTCWGTIRCALWR